MLLLDRPRLARRSFERQLRVLLRRSRIALPVASLPGDPADEDRHDRRHLVVGLVKGFVDDHVHEDISLDRLAEEVGLSKYHLARLFREVAGQTPWTYVQEARVREAQRLLREGRPLAEVALDAGFYDQSHLTRVFKAVTGQTPGQWQRAQEQPPEAA